MRRTFLLITCLSALVAHSMVATPAMAQATADLVLVNGRVCTLDSRHP